MGWRDCAAGRRSDVHWRPAGSAIRYSRSPSQCAQDSAPAAETKFQRVRSVAELDAVLKNRHPPCDASTSARRLVHLSCKEMERFTFADPPRPAARRLPADPGRRVTANNDDDKALLKRFNLLRPAGYLPFDAGGAERKQLRVVGFQEAWRFSEGAGGSTSPEGAALALGRLARPRQQVSMLDRIVCATIPKRQTPFSKRGDALTMPDHSPAFDEPLASSPTSIWAGEPGFQILREAARLAGFHPAPCWRGFRSRSQ